MTLTQGMSLCGFTVTQGRTGERLCGTLWEMIHDKTGARLCWVENGQENKLFSVTFRTTPENDTGVFHILEHSVLCGSEQFPVKEPFVDLLKGSMNTFLNAMTYPDKTVYPVSSRNERDFLNLTRVYLDAVFAPALLHNPSVFHQEGRHIAFGGDGAAYNGVVFNEMKGAMSGVNDRIEQELDALLFPDSCYRFNSGGDPAAIPTLTYEDFVSVYRRFYHPSNARFFLDGDLPLERTLTLIDGYLSRYDKAPEPAPIALQTPVSGEKTAWYEVDEDVPERDVLAFAKIVGRYDETVRIAAAQALCSLLASSNEAPLKRALLASGLAQDVDLFVNDGILQPYLALIVRNTRDEQCEQLRQVIRDTVTGLLKTGLDKRDLLAVISRMEFDVRQIPEPQGLYRALGALSSWLYGGDPLMPLEPDGVFCELRRMVEQQQFEPLLRELFLDESTEVLLHMRPSTTVGEEAEAAQQAQLQTYLKTASEAELQRLHAEEEALHRWQQTPDSEEARASLPVLPLSEVSTEPLPLVTQETTEQGVRTLYHPGTTNGIVHMAAYFPLTKLDPADLGRLAVLTELYTELPTRQHTAEALQREIKTYIGHLVFGITTFAKEGEPGLCKPCLYVRAGFLRENSEAAQRLIGEILTETQFDQPQRVEEIVRQLDEENRQTAITSGQMLGIMTVRAQYSARDAAAEQAGGYSYMQSVRTLASRFADDYPALMQLAKTAGETALCRSNVIVSVTADTPLPLTVLTGTLPKGAASPEWIPCATKLPQKAGIRIPSPVSYAVKGFHLRACDTPFEGSLRVAANILSLSHLWNRVRVQGGAYGAGMPVSRDGGFLCYSYRDPSPAQSLTIYEEAADFLEAFAAGDEEALDKFILSAVANTDPLQTPAERGSTADEAYIAGLREERRRRTRREMLETDRASLTRWCAPLRRMAAEGAVCVVGSKAVLAQLPELTVLELE